ncbi:MAG: hypothetical protein KIS67_03220 [Verrucomicrobiae bacterium]|nr:hypothetical protein [Verrucomicrobiae bacterium]
MKIDGQNMPPLRGLNLFGFNFYKDVTPTALGNSRMRMTSETVIQKIFDELPVP